MKAKDLIAQLQNLDGDEEVYFSSCCYPETRWFQVSTDSDGVVTLEGYEGSYVMGDPDVSPFKQGLGKP